MENSTKAAMKASLEFEKRVITTTRTKPADYFFVGYAAGYKAAAASLLELVRIEKRVYDETNGSIEAAISITMREFEEQLTNIVKEN